VAAQTSPPPTEVDFDDDGVTVTGHNGEVFRARYLIDAGGFRSPLARKFDLRDEPTRLKHHARGMFTHYIGVKPFDEVSRHPDSARPPVPWHSGTLHHLIDRGWFWIIPFDNIKGSCNLMCSVGLTIDERRYPVPEDMTPEQEFQSFLDQYPAVKRQFTNAKRVREWVSAGRLQYSSKRSVGPRWCLMSHASGFIDPLYSRGLSNTFEVVHAVCTRILESLEDDDWSMERYEYVDTLERGLIQYNDELVNNSYISFSHYRLWNAVFRVWGSCITPAGMRLNRAVSEYERDGDARHLRALEDSEYPGLWWPETEFKNIFDLTTKSCEAYEAGQLTGDEAADAIFAALKECDHLDDIFGWKDESHRFVYPATGAMARYVYWAVRKTPDPELRTISQALLKSTLKKGQRPR
jgi:tetracycline 7-halogenase / FADH2 O2-dependent halogenase